MILEDAVRLPWSDEEAAALLEMGGFEATLARPLAGGAHFRPYPGAAGTLLMLWEAVHAHVEVPEPPPPLPEASPLFAELVLRALTRMVPALGGYFDGADGSLQASVTVDAGYYTSTPDNLPLIGPLPGGPRNAFVCAGLSGYGVMASNAAGELLAAHVLGEEEALPGGYAPAFAPARWLDREYAKRVAAGAEERGLQI